MEKIKVETDLKHDVYINGYVDIQQVPQDLLDAFITSLTKQIIEIKKS